MVIGMGKEKDQAIVQAQTSPHPLAALDFENAPPTLVVSSLAFELRSLADGIDHLTDIALDLKMSGTEASLHFRAYGRKPGLT